SGKKAVPITLETIGGNYVILEIALAQIEDHVIAANGLKRDRHRFLARTPFVVRYAVLHIGYHGICNSENLGPICIPVRIAYRVAPKGFSIFANSRPINRETLRD